MATQRERTSDRLIRRSKPQTAGKDPGPEFPIQREIRRLEEELHAFNERIAELKDEGHHSHAVYLLKVNALDFARRIDELRCVLVEVEAKPDCFEDRSRMK
jgi:hypothetical protein